MKRFLAAAGAAAFLSCSASHAVNNFPLAKPQLEEKASPETGIKPESPLSESERKIWELEDTIGSMRITRRYANGCIYHVDRVLVDLKAVPLVVRVLELSREADDSHKRWCGAGGWSIKDIREIAQANPGNPGLIPAIPFLIEALMDKGARCGSLVDDAMEAFASIGPEAVPAVLGLLKHEESAQRMWAAHILHAIAILNPHDQRLLAAVGPLTETAKNDTKEWVAEAARSALKSFETITPASPK